MNTSALLPGRRFRRVSPKQTVGNTRQLAIAAHLQAVRHAALLLA